MLPVRFIPATYCEVLLVMWSCSKGPWDFPGGSYELINKKSPAPSAASLCSMSIASSAPAASNATISSFRIRVSVLVSWKFHASMVSTGPVKAVLHKNIWPHGAPFLNIQVQCTEPCDFGFSPWCAFSVYTIVNKLTTW